MKIGGLFYVIAILFLMSSIVIAQNNDSDMNETDSDMNETDPDMNETDIDMNETDSDMNETDSDMNETDIDMNETDDEIELKIKAETKEGRAKVKVEYEYLSALEEDSEIYSELHGMIVLSNEEVSAVFESETTVEEFGNKHELETEIEERDEGKEVEFEYRFVLESDSKEDIIAGIVEVLAALTIDEITNGIDEGSDEIDSDNDGVDDETEEESEEFASLHGARMRMYQLERGIRKRILWGEEIVIVLSEAEKDVERLEAILAELGILADEAHEIAEGEIDDLSVDKFISIKKDAKALIKEFRDIVKDELTAAEKAILRARFNEIDKNELRELSGKIKEKRCELNAERVTLALETMDVSDDELVVKVRNCDISAGSALSDIRKHAKKLSDEKKDEIRGKIEEEARKRKSEVEAKIQERAAKELENAADRLEARAAKLRSEGFKRFTAESNRALRRAR